MLHLSDATFGQEANIAHTTCVRQRASKQSECFSSELRSRSQVAIKIQNADEMLAAWLCRDFSSKRYMANETRKRFLLSAWAWASSTAPSLAAVSRTFTSLCGN